MKDQAAPVPYLATLQMTLSGLPVEIAADLGDWLMVALLEQPDVVDPILTSDLDSDELGVSYEFGATGDVKVDVPKAIALLANAIERRSKTDEPQRDFSWKAWLDGLDVQSAGSVQYPIPAVLV